MLTSQKSSWWLGICVIFLSISDLKLIPLMHHIMRAFLTIWVIQKLIQQTRSHCGELSLAVQRRRCKHCLRRQEGQSVASRGFFGHFSWMPRHLTGALEFLKDVVQRAHKFQSQKVNLGDSSEHSTVIKTMRVWYLTDLGSNTAFAITLVLWPLRNLLNSLNTSFFVFKEAIIMDIIGLLWGLKNTPFYVQFSIGNQ